LSHNQHKGLSKDQSEYKKVENTGYSRSTPSCREGRALTSVRQNGGNEQGSRHDQLKEDELDLEITRCINKGY